MVIFAQTFHLKMMFLSAYYRNYLQVGLYDVAYCCSSSVYWYLDQIEDLYSASRPSQMVLSRFWVSIASIHDDLDDMVQ